MIRTTLFKSKLCRQEEYHLPQGLIPDVLPHAPVTNYAITKPESVNWWNEPSREVGKVTKKMRKIYVVNMLFCSEPENVEPDLLLVGLMRHFHLFSWIIGHSREMNKRVSTTTVKNRTLTNKKFLISILKLQIANLNNFQ